MMYYRSAAVIVQQSRKHISYKKLDDLGVLVTDETSSVYRDMILSTVVKTHTNVFVSPPRENK